MTHIVLSTNTTMTVMFAGKSQHIIFQNVHFNQIKMIIYIICNSIPPLTSYNYSRGGECLTDFTLNPIPAAT